MKINIQISLILFITLIIYGFQCNKEDDFKYNLELPFQITPIKKTYKINDTIEIKAIINERKLKDLISQNLIEVNCSDIPFTLYIGVRESDFNQLQDKNLFETIIDTTTFKNNQIENNGQYYKLSTKILNKFLDNNEISIIKLIPQKKGVYLIMPQLNYIANYSDCNDLRATYNSFLTPIFDVDNTNPELLDKSPLPKNVFISGDRIPILTNEKRIFWLEIID